VLSFFRADWNQPAFIRRSGPGCPAGPRTVFLSTLLCCALHSLKEVRPVEFYDYIMAGVLVVIIVTFFYKMGPDRKKSKADNPH